jgi:SPP1 family predicted phage head-tail adaptor
MHIGSRDRQITIQSPTGSVDSEGTVTKSWSTGTQVWAEVLQFGGRELFKHEKITPEVDTLFRIDYLDFTPSRRDRIVYNSTNYNIFNVRELGYADGLEISGKAKSS